MFVVHGIDSCCCEQSIVRIWWNSCCAYGETIVRTWGMILRTWGTIVRIWGTIVRIWGTIVRIWGGKLLGLWGDNCENMGDDCRAIWLSGVASGSPRQIMGEDQASYGPESLGHG